MLLAQRSVFFFENGKTDIVQLVEDMSDNYYEQLHRKFEAFERRQRIREREKLQFERYKMRARIELLRNLPGPQWASVMQAILARADNGRWARGRRKLELEGGADWLRRRLIREGQEVLGRYDQLLPNESKKCVFTALLRRLTRADTNPSVRARTRARTKAGRHRLLPAPCLLHRNARTHTTPSGRACRFPTPNLPHPANLPLAASR